MMRSKDKILLWLSLLALLFAGGQILGPPRAVTRASVVSDLGVETWHWMEVEIAGTIDVDTTWTADDGPYIVSGDLTISEGVTLTIEPGVEVRFETTDDQSSGEDPDRVELIVAGTLVADGVTFTSNAASPAGGDWYGIRFLDSSTDWNGDAGCVIRNSVVEYASVAISINGSSLLLMGNMISDITGKRGESGTDSCSSGQDGQPGIGIYVSGDSVPTIANSVIRRIRGGTGGSSSGSFFCGPLQGGNGGDAAAIYDTSGAAPTVLNTMIYDVQGGDGGQAFVFCYGKPGGPCGIGGDGGDSMGLHLEDSTVISLNSTIAHTISGSGGRGDSRNGIAGLRFGVRAVSSSLILTNDILVDHDYGIMVTGVPTPTLAYINVWNNRISDYSGLAPGPNDLAVDPVFIAPDDYDYHLCAGSPLVDAGTNEGAPNTDFEGDPRPYDGDSDGDPIVDIGADESTTENPILKVNPLTLAFSAGENGPNPEPQTLTILNCGRGTLDWMIQDNTDWLTVTPSTGSDGTTVNVAVDISGLLGGSYTATITVTAVSTATLRSPQIVPIHLTVVPPEMRVYPQKLHFYGHIEGTDPPAQEISITNAASDGPLDWLATEDTTWLTITPTLGTAPLSLIATVDLAGLALGTYTGTITITGTSPTIRNSPQIIPAYLEVIHPMRVHPQILHFYGQIEGTNPPAQEISITNAASDGPLEWLATEDSTWLDITPTSGTTPLPVVATVDLAGLAVGTYTGTITITGTSPTIRNSPQTVTVRLLVSPADVLNLPVAASTDDAREFDDGNYSDSSPAVILGDYNCVSDNAGFRFSQASIPRRAIITEAELTLSAYTMWATWAQFIIRGEASGDSPTFSPLNSPRHRPATSAETIWEVTEPWYPGQTYTSPDLSAIVQEIVDRPDWVAGNALSLLIFDGHPGCWGTRRVATWDDHPSHAPLLTMKFCDLISDLDRNRVVDVLDVASIAAHRRSVPEPGSPYDLDQDGDVDIVDIASVVKEWGQRCP